MANKSHLDDLINYKENVIRSISESQKVLSLISNNPNIVVGSAEAEDIVDNHIYNFDYVPTTQQTSTAVVLIDSDMVRATSTTKRVELYVQIIVSKNYMDLRGQGFIGLKGNRRDNLIRFIDLLISNSQDYGIGRLNLESAITAKVPDDFTSKLLTYVTPNFSRNRELGNV